MIAKFIDRPREDSLTAAVFGHLLHLPMEQCWQILRDACPSSQFPEFPGDPLAIHAWPSWSAKGTSNTHRVVPDLVIEFKAFDLIVEAKRWDVPMQDKEQWKRELKAYVTEYGSKKRAVIMLALGGIHTHQDDELEAVWNPGGPDEHPFNCPVFMCQWSSVLLACQRQKRKLLQRPETSSSRALADIRILDDLTSLFVRHDFAPLRWFEDFSFSDHLLGTSADSEQKQFRETSRQLRQA
jgi:hypothetical protein